MDPEICGVVTQMLFYAVTWGTLGTVTSDRLKTVKRVRETASQARRNETWRYQHEYQHLRLNLLRTQQDALAEPLMAQPMPAYSSHSHLRVA